jgi:hypothetical protein
MLIELAVLAGVKPHPNVVGFLGACVEDLSAPLIIEEYVHGPNLEDYLYLKQVGFNLGQPKVLLVASSLLFDVFLLLAEDKMTLVTEYTNHKQIEFCGPIPCQ